MQELLDRLFSPNKILLVYRCGSSIFGLSENESDKDFTVIIDGFDSCNVVKTDDCDFFTFGRSYFEKLKNFDKSCLTYFLCWVDNTLLAKENIVYVYNTLVKAKPSTVKGKYIQNVSISTTMGPGIHVDENSIDM